MPATEAAAGDAAFPQLQDKVVFLTGATGGVGKVILHQLLRHTPVAKVVCLVRRAADGLSARERLKAEVLSGEVLRSLHRAGWRTEDVHARVDAIEGDVSSSRFGLDEADFRDLAAGIDLVINCAGLVDFQGPIDAEIGANARGPQQALALAQMASRPDRRVPLCHVSTCFVSGIRQGHIEEEQDVTGYPRQRELGRAFDPVREIEELEQLARHVREDGLSEAAAAEAVARLRAEGGGTPVAERRVRRELDQQVTRRLVEVGTRRAAVWGWPNTYTLSKALGEKLLLATHGEVPLTIVRPAIVSVAVQDPCPGWTDAKNTIAPLVYLAWRGQRQFPVHDQHVLDLIPVDYVANGIIAVAAESLLGRAGGVYQLCSGDTNPLRAGRLMELLGLGLRKEGQARPDVGWMSRMRAGLGPLAVSARQFDRFSTPRWQMLLGRVTSVAARVPRMSPEVSGSPILGCLEQGRQRIEQLVAKLQRDVQLAGAILESYRPFTHDLHPRFSARRMHALHAGLRDAERSCLPFAPQSLDWRRYWLELQLEGLYRHSFPTLGVVLRPSELEVDGETLPELLAAVAKRHRSKVAVQRLTAVGPERLTFGQLADRVRSLAARLQQAGLGPGDRVGLLAENAPSWVAVWFAVLETGAVVVPLDARSSRDQAARLLELSGARLLLWSDRQRDRLRAQPSGPNGTVGDTDAWPCPTVSIEDLVGGAALPQLPVGSADGAEELGLEGGSSAGRVAAILYTSGTTGGAKGVMLTHDNLLFLVANLAKIYRIGPSDATLSVLPLHHAFELCAGLLFPLSRGVTISYLDELTPDAVRGALQSVGVTMMTAVPALLEMLNAGIDAGLRARGERVAQVVDTMTPILESLRDRTGLNLGKWLLAPVHEAFGKNFRFFVSGGAALRPALFHRFRGIGLDIFEGYGMTEASPVIAAASPTRPPVAGSVGPPVPGVEVRIAEPDEEGVGEVLARGRSVMAGYFRQPRLTAETIGDGWLRTGDLGRLDGSGNLRIVGRKKELIVDRAGNSVYPDELEEAYGGSAFVAELSIVGLDGGATVACVVVPAYAVFPHHERAEVDRQVRQHLQRVAATLPPYKRIRRLCLTDVPLPRTAARKVKRAELQDRFVSALSDGPPEGSEATEQSACRRQVIEALTSVTGIDVESVRDTEALSLLGVDSLALVEVVAALERGLGVKLGSGVDRLLTVGDLVAAVAGRIGVPSSETEVPQPAPSGEPPFQLPGLVRTVGRALVRVGRRSAVRALFPVEATGGAFVPWHTPSIVVANHCSHLDVAVVLEALGAYARNAVVLAAGDYFFTGPVRSFVFSNFSDLLPVDRATTGWDGMRRAVKMLDAGRSVVLFPEGTRSPDGKLQSFRPGVGALALESGRGILPLCIEGTFPALPKGALLLRPGPCKVRIGPPLTADFLREQTAGLSRIGAARRIAAVAEGAVRSLETQNRRSRPAALSVEQQPPIKPPTDSAPLHDSQFVDHPQPSTGGQRAVQS